jgi:DNA-binding NarL/FixJ family response regulator
LRRAVRLRTYGARRGGYSVSQAATIEDQENAMTDRSPTAHVFTLDERSRTGNAVSRTVPFEPRDLVDEYRGCARDLTAREYEVLAMLCEGLPNKLIARRLNIGTGTVKCHVGSILIKMGASSRLEAVVEAYRRGLIGAAPAQDLTAQRR